MKPRFLELVEAGTLDDRARQGISLLGHPCRVCPHYCPVDRQKNEKAICRTGRWASVHSVGAAYGVEAAISGWQGSGTFQFASCSLECVFCQKSEEGPPRKGKTMEAAEFAQMMVELQTRGCHNIRFVNPSHVVPQIVEALALAAKKGFHLPVVYETCTFDSRESLALLDGLVDIYVTEFRFWDDSAAKELTLEKGYGEVSRQAMREMHRQVGDLQLGTDGLARRGLLVRHLVMPKDVAGTRGLMKFLASEISKETYVNLAASYEPMCKASEYPDINRPTTFEEYQQAVKVAYQEGLQRLETRETQF